MISRHRNAIHTDQVMNPVRLNDATGTIVWDRVTTPFGGLVWVGPNQTISVTGPLTQTLRFPGQRNDSETGLFQNWHRDYDASLGRYVQSDPIGLAGGINTYAYVGGNPVTYVDPTGLDFKALGTIGNGQIVGPIPDGVFWIIDLPSSPKSPPGAPTILFGCGDNLPDGPIDVDFFHDPRVGGKNGEWTKIVTGDIRFYSRPVNIRHRATSFSVGSTYATDSGRSIYSALQPFAGQWTIYGFLTIQPNPRSYLEDLRTGKEKSLNDSCVGLAGRK